MSAYRTGLKAIAARGKRAAGPPIWFVTGNPKIQIDGTPGMIVPIHPDKVTVFNPPAPLFLRPLCLSGWRR